MATEDELLRQEAASIVQSGALGRSRSYARLLEFLVECAQSGRTPKELEIAMEVFGRGADFDPSQDSMVRVYAHNLRQKLEHYYATAGRQDARRLVLARGEYRISLAVPDEPQEAPDLAAAAAAAAEPPAVHWRLPLFKRWRLAAAGAALFVAGIAIGAGIALNRVPAAPAQAVAKSPLWADMLDDDLPILLVVGDYYIYAELDERGDVARLVRDFSVGSSKELDELMKNDSTLLARYLDLDLTYLPTGSASALLDVLRVLYTSNKPVRVVSMSAMSEADLKSSHVVYIGYLSALDKLEDFVFASSTLAIGYTYDELRNMDTGELYTSEAGMPEANRNYRDYAFISTFPGPGGNQLLIVAGTRDAGLMQAAHSLADPVLVASMEQQRPPGSRRGEPPSFEMLYEVTGYGRTNLDAMLVHTAALNYQEIWGGVLRPPPAH
jgi:F0F1-type ATP synthase membrane subunit c/vacuolar-type H+-ATPase subunit K